MNKAQATEATKPELSEPGTKMLLDAVLAEGEDACRRCGGRVPQGARVLLVLNNNEGLLTSNGVICTVCKAQIPQGELIPANQLGPPVVGPPRKG